MAAILDGLRVVEFSHLIAAPAVRAARCRTWGAEVVKVEPPEGDYTRTLEPVPRTRRQRLLPDAEPRQARRSRSTSAPRGRASSRGALIDSADVVVESLGDVRERALGIDYAEASSRNEKLIWCSITGTGRGSGGPRDRPTLQASMGMMALTGEPGRPPMRLPVPLVDFMTAMYATQSVLAALLAGPRRGPGRPARLRDDRRRRRAGELGRGPRGATARRCAGWGPRTPGTSRPPTSRRPTASGCR